MSSRQLSPEHPAYTQAPQAPGSLSSRGWAEGPVPELVGVSHCLMGVSKEPHAGPLTKGSVTPFTGLLPTHASQSPFS